MIATDGLAMDASKQITQRPTTIQQKTIVKGREPAYLDIVIKPKEQEANTNTEY